MLLTNDRRKFGKLNTSHHLHVFRQQGRTGLKTYRRQLSGISYQNHLTFHTSPYERYKVLQKVTGTESCCRLLLAGVYAYQRNLIDDEKSFLILVWSQAELTEPVSPDRFLAIYMLMYRIRRLAGI